RVSAIIAIGEIKRSAEFFELAQHAQSRPLHFEHLSARLAVGFDRSGALNAGKHRHLSEWRAVLEGGNRLGLSSNVDLNRTIHHYIESVGIPIALANYFHSRRVFEHSDVGTDLLAWAVVAPINRHLQIDPIFVPMTR